MSRALWQEAAAFAGESHKHQTRNDKRPYVSHCFSSGDDGKYRFWF